MGPGGTVIHVAPPAKLVSSLIANSQAWLSETDAHPLIASAVFHYEFEFIHPFVDGNGRIGSISDNLESIGVGQIAHAPNWHVILFAIHFPPRTDIVGIFPFPKTPGAEDVLEQVIAALEGIHCV